MKNLIYYPGFNLDNINWVKYALLYVEELRPIIPVKGDDSVVGMTRLIKEHTNLIRPMRPNREHSKVASAHALKIFEELFRNERKYKHEFRLYDLYNSKENHQTWNTTLYQEKYALNFENFCVENGYGEFCSEGIRISSTLAGIYMSLLANSISEIEDRSCITDNSEFGRINLLLQALDAPRAHVIESNSQVRVKREKFVMHTINKALPTNISEIPLEKIIEFRNSQGYLSNLMNFNRSIDNYISSINSGTVSDNQSLIEYMENTNRTLVNELIKLSPTLFSFMLGVGCMISNNSQFVESLGTLAVGASAVSTLYTLSSNNGDDEVKRKSRKYIADMSQIPV